MSLKRKSRSIHALPSAKLVNSRSGLSYEEVRELSATSFVIDDVKKFVTEDMGMKKDAVNNTVKLIRVLSDKTSKLRAFLRDKEYYEDFTPATDMYRLKTLLKSFELESNDRSHNWWSSTPLNNLLYFQVYAATKKHVWHLSTNENVQRKPELSNGEGHDSPACVHSEWHPESEDDDETLAQRQKRKGFAVAKKVAEDDAGRNDGDEVHDRSRVFEDVSFEKLSSLEHTERPSFSTRNDSMVQTNKEYLTVTLPFIEEMHKEFGDMISYQCAARNAGSREYKFSDESRVDLICFYKNPNGDKVPLILAESKCAAVVREGYKVLQYQQRAKKEWHNYRDDFTILLILVGSKPAHDCNLLDANDMGIHVWWPGCDKRELVSLMNRRLWREEMEWEEWY